MHAPHGTKPVCLTVRRAETPERHLSACLCLRLLTPTQATEGKEQSTIKDSSDEARKERLEKIKTQQITTKIRTTDIGRSVSHRQAYISTVM